MTQASHSSKHHPVLELVHSTHKNAELFDRRFGQADLGRTAIKMMAGSRAFRKYSALADTIGLNKSKNLRGMVVSEKWQTIFKHTSEIGEYMENIGYLATIASELAKPDLALRMRIS